MKVTIISFVTLLLFELCYRNSVIDFYETEIFALNSREDLQETSVDLMIFGDSFSATSKEINYVDRLRDVYPEKTILNYSIPGTGIRQVNVFAKQKIVKHNPKAILYQIYVGNDLLDVEKFINFNNISFSKYSFWQASNIFLSLPYLNHKASILKPKVNYRHKTLAINNFSINYYNKRSKHNLLINPNYLEETVRLNGRFKVKYEKWLEEIKSFLISIPEDTEVSFVWIPHCTQVNDYYLDNFKSLKAQFKNPKKHLDLNYAYFNRALKDMKSFKNLKLINTLSAFKKEDKVGKRMFFANDPHLNKLGNDVLANYLNTIYFQGYFLR